MLLIIILNIIYFFLLLKYTAIIDIWIDNVKPQHNIQNSPSVSAIAHRQLLGGGDAGISVSLSGVSISFGVTTGYNIVLPLLYPLYVVVHEEDWCIKLPAPAPRAINIQQQCQTEWI